jgi:membrane protein DedA with SNARE-associated domain
VLLTASLTGPVVHLATNVIDSLGLAGVAFMIATSAVIGLPGTEPVMLFAGFDVYNHHLTMLGIIAFGVLGDLVGASIGYAIGYWGEEWIERHGGKFHLNAKRLERARNWFDRYGTVAVFISRLIPGARFAFPYVAGIAKMPYWRFIVAAAAGSALWITGLAFLGRAVGSDWQSWRNHLEYVDYFFIGVVVVAIAYFILRRVRASRGGPPAVDAVSD